MESRRAFDRERGIAAVRALETYGTQVTIAGSEKVPEDPRDRDRGLALLAHAL